VGKRLLLKRLRNWKLLGPEARPNASRLKFSAYFLENGGPAPKHRSFGRYQNTADGSADNEKPLRYCDDGRLEIDNNVAKRALRVVALGRKNFLFAGFHRWG